MVYDESADLANLCEFRMIASVSTVCAEGKYTIYKIFEKFVGRKGIVHNTSGSPKRISCHSKMNDSASITQAYKMFVKKQRIDFRKWIRSNNV
jgi:hypothetical protein